MIRIRMVVHSYSSWQEDILWNVTLCIRLLYMKSSQMVETHWCSSSVATWITRSVNTTFFKLLRALKSPQKFRIPSYSSANFLGSCYISGLKSKFCYEIWTFWLILQVCSCPFFQAIWNGVFPYVRLLGPLE